MNKPNRHLDLCKTNYFANLKRKAKNPKDAKEQSVVNVELLNCIDILEKRIVELEDVNSKILENLFVNNDAIRGILSHTRAIEEIIGREKVREVYEQLKKEDEVKTSENVEK